MREVQWRPNSHKKKPFLSQRKFKSEGTTVFKGGNPHLFTYILKPKALTTFKGFSKVFGLLGTWFNKNSFYPEIKSLLDVDRFQIRIIRAKVSWILK